MTSRIRESAVLPDNEPGSEPWPLEATVVEMDTQLRGSVVNPKSMRKVEDEECIGGMVRAARAVASLPGNLVVGGQVKKIVDSFLVGFPHVIDDCYHAVGSDSENAGPKLQDVEAFRIRLGKHLEAEDWGPTCGDCTSSICHGLLSAWANLAQDPGKVAADWVRHGVSFLWRSRVTKIFWNLKTSRAMSRSSETTPEWTRTKTCGLRSMSL